MIRRLCAGPASPEPWLRLLPPPPWRLPGSFIRRRVCWTPVLSSRRRPPSQRRCQAPPPTRRPRSRSAGKMEARPRANPSLFARSLARSLAPEPAEAMLVLRLALILGRPARLHAPRTPALGAALDPCVLDTGPGLSPGTRPGSFSRSPPWTPAYPSQGCSTPCYTTQPPHRLLPPASGCIPRAAAAMLRRFALGSRAGAEEQGEGSIRRPLVRPTGLVPPRVGAW